ncbi:MAG: alpha/beta fold hydrolase [Pirellula sp.]|nr:alpha/beta fold hydrolase [Pirellula sp.]
MAVSSWATGRFAIAVIAVWITCTAGGCRLFTRDSFRTTAALHDCPSVVHWPDQGSRRDRAILFSKLAKQWSEASDPRSVDYFFQAAALSWLELAESPEQIDPEHPFWEIYHTSLQGLVSDGARFQRFDGAGGLIVYSPDGELRIPMVSRGLDWPIEQVQRYQIPDLASARKLKHYYKQPGMGIPVLAFRTKPMGAREDSVERFIPSKFPLAATLLLRGDGAGGVEIEVANPLRVDATEVEECSIPIAKDISCPLEYQLQNRPTNPITGFLLPGSGNQDDGLRWAEGYQPGKIPVVFIHGLMSEPTAWMDMVNQLRRYRWFNQHYQVWGFGYATGSPFVTSAMRLRSQCNEAIRLLDPEMEDPALREMVLIGHSMGGLLAKLQVADSGDRLWRSVSRVPIDQLHATEVVKNELRQRLFFTSQSHVTRVVYIATPHQGSSFASRAPGRFFSSFVRPDEQNQALHEKLVADNPDAFIGIFRKRIPSSVDLLEPNDASLKAIYHLPVPEHVQQHTILGTGETPLTLGKSDGVVSVESASHPAAKSEVHVEAAHTKIHTQDAAIAEVTRLLWLHLVESGIAPSQPDS